MLANLAGVAEGVEQVVSQLEAQAQVLPEQAQVLAVGLRCPSEVRAHLERTAQQHGGLQADHLQVFRQGHVVALLEVHVLLLALADLQGVSAEQFEDHGIAGHQLVGLHQHGITAQDGGVHAPLRMHGGLPPAQGGGVHDVVVHQGEVVEELDAQGGVERPVRIATEELATQERGRRTNPLGGQVQQVGHGRVEAVDRKGPAPGLQALLDPGAVFVQDLHVGLSSSFSRYSP